MPCAFLLMRPARTTRCRVVIVSVGLGRGHARRNPRASGDPVFQPSRAYWIPAFAVISVLPSKLAANPEASDQIAVARLVFALHIIEQAAALADHLQQTATGMVVALMGLEVLGEVGDPLGQDRDLHVRRAGIARF